MLLFDVKGTLTWEFLTKLLEIPCESAVLPSRTTCPHCKGRANIYHDSITSGLWHYCLDCGKSGDQFHFAATVWDVSYAQAVRRVAARFGYETDKIDQLVESHLLFNRQPRERASQLWSLAQARLLQPLSPGLHRIRSRLYLRTQLNGDQWKTGPGRILGAVDYAILKQTFSGTTRLKRQLVRFRNEAFVFPYELAPGQIIGFQFIGREGSPEDRIFVSTYQRNHNGNEEREAGLYGLVSVLAPHPTFGETVIACADPAVIARLQIRNAASSHRLLPLIGWYAHGRERTDATWRCLHRRHIVFWGWTITAGMIHQARLCEGSIAVSRIENMTTDNIDRFLRIDTPLDTLRKVVRRARPWRDVLRKWAEHQSPETIDDILIELEQMHVPILEIAQIMGPPAVQLIRAPSRRIVSFGNVEYFETNGCWYANPTVRNQFWRRQRQRLISEVILRIDWIETGETPKYTGKIIYCDTEIPVVFTSCKGKVVREEILAACLQAHLPRPYLHGGQHDWIEIASRFQRPRVVTVTTDPDNRPASVAAAPERSESD